MRDLLREARAHLARAGVDPADAERLARGLLPEGTLLEILDHPPEDFEEAFRAAVARRAAREPLQLILGRVGFRELVLHTGPGVFIPRVETELVSGVAIDAARAAVSRRGSARVVDLCTGSGAIAAALASEVAGARVWAVELDPAALDLAALSCNAAGLGVALVPGDRGRAADLDGTVDVVVANPPYVPPDEYAIPRSATGTRRTPCTAADPTASTCRARSCGGRPACCGRVGSWSWSTQTSRGRRCGRNSWRSGPSRTW